VTRLNRSSRETPEPAEPELSPALAILEALEFGKAKEEKELLDPVLAALNLDRREDSGAMARRIVDGPGVEAFLFAVLKEIQPFAAMLKEVYAFLNRHASTVERRATTLRVSKDGAEAALDFSLDNFPHELVRSLSEAWRERLWIELRLEEPATTVMGEDRDQRLWHAWHRVSPNWDEDFYDDGFHRALSYALAVLGSRGTAAWTELEGIVGETLSRLAAITRYGFEQGWFELRSFSLSVLTRRSEGFVQGPTLEPQLVGSGSRVSPWNLGDSQAKSTPRDGPDRNKDLRLPEGFHWLLYGLAISLHLHHHAHVERTDDRGWIERRLGKPQEEVTPREYLDLMRELEAAYRVCLDEVAPVVGREGYRALEEQLREFLLLPFWKHRWFLYELWTLVEVLKLAEAVGSVELLAVRPGEEGHLEWALPGGKAGEPVARIVTAERTLLVWTQRLTFHPGTGEQLEPDLRVSLAEPDFRDVLVIENKDRRKPSGPEMAEIAERYLTGTGAKALWLVNYDQFPSTLNQLEASFPSGRVRVVSEFKPGQLPDDFERSVRSCLEGGRQERSAVCLKRGELKAVLEWAGPPSDLDLWARIVRTDGSEETVFYGRKGALALPPFAELDVDARGGEGRETLVVKLDKLERLELVVHNYSSDEALSRSGAVVRVVGGGFLPLRVAVPSWSAGVWWHVLTFHSSPSRVDIHSRVSDQAPTWR
jgi:hypothetical protein